MNTVRFFAAVAAVAFAVLLTGPGLRAQRALPVAQDDTDEPPASAAAAVYDPAAPDAAGPFWVSGYVASWTLNMGSGTNGNYGNMPYQSLDLDAVTHLIMFAAAIGSDGSVTYNSMVSSRRRPFNDYVHSRGKPILMSIGGAGNTAFSSAMTSAYRTNLVRNLLNSIRTERYDGIDIDIEPVTSGDASNIRLFVRQLYDSLRTMRAWYDPSRRPILTCAVYNQQGLWAELSPYFDQVNLMSYDLFGTWFGKSWHNNAPLSGSGDVDAGGTPMTTVRNKMERYLSAGIPAAKFGVGIDFNGYVWKGGLLSDGSGNGVTAPRQRWSVAPVMQGNEIPGWQIVRDWVERYPSSVRYDNVCKVPYVGVDNGGSSSDYYVTYQDTSTVKEIVRLARGRGIGGVILWEIGGGFFGPSQFPSRALRDPMLQAVRQEAFGVLPPPPPPADLVPPTVALTSPAGGATLSGTVTLSAQAGDDVGVASVQFYLNGSAFGAALSSAPYSKSWSTSLNPNGTYAVSAVARDAAGNTATSAVNVTVSNSVAGGADLPVYTDELLPPWIRTPWSAVVTFGSTEQSYTGGNSIKVVQSAWGSMSVHSGSWYAPVPVSTSPYRSVEFAVYGGPAGATISLMFENDYGNSFPTVSGGFVPANAWKVMSIPMDALNPEGRTVHRLDIMEKSGVLKTYYLDDIRFVGAAASSTVAAPRPESGETGTPVSFALDQNYPNPFNPSTVISYSLARDADVSLEIFNSIGQSVRTLADGIHPAGRNEIRFDASGLPGGVYFYRLIARTADGGKPESFTEMKKMVLMK